MGLAGWLTERFGAELWMSREEFLMRRAMVADTGREVPAVALRFYRAAGYDDAQLAFYQGRFGNFGRAVYPLPDSFRRLVDLETITIGGRYWQLIVGSGHSPEHLALYCPALKLLISGTRYCPGSPRTSASFPTGAQRRSPAGMASLQRAHPRDAARRCAGAAGPRGPFLRAAC